MALDPPDLSFGLCALGIGFPELGRVRLSKIEPVTGRGGLLIERDRSFRTTATLQAYAEEANRSGRVLA